MEKTRKGLLEVHFERKDRYTIDDLLKIMQMLRSPEGCPWDREQTHASIRKNFLEETYEVLEAIDNQDPALLREELGDVLLQVVFHAQMEAERGVFDFADVVHDICAKLIVRHPHVFAGIHLQEGSSDEVLANWEAIKKRQKGQKTQTETLLSVPKVLPALMRSTKVQQRASKTGFDYPNLEGAMADLHAELAELEAEVDAGEQDKACEELGDLLFSAVNVSRFLKTDAEETLTRACEKFIGRFEKVEKLAGERGINMRSAGMEQLDALWREAKKM